jgi:hypothetical protein
MKLDQGFFFGAASQTLDGAGRSPPQSNADSDSLKPLCKMTCSAPLKEVIRAKQTLMDVAPTRNAPPNLNAAGY